MPVVWSDRHRLPRARAARSGSASRTPGTELPARAERIRAALDAAGARASSTPSAHADDALLAVHDAELLDVPRAAPGTSGRRPGSTDDPGQDRVVPYLFAHPGLTRRPPGRSRRRPAARAGQFAYDTMTLIGPGTWEAARAARRRRAHRRRPRRSPASRAAYACCRPPGPPRRRAPLRRLLLPQQRRRRGRRACARRVGGAGRRDRHRRPPRQRHAGDLLRRPRRARRLGPRRPGRRLVPALPRLRGRDAAPARAGANRNVAARPGRRRRGTGSAAVRELARWRRAAAPRRSSSPLGVDAAAGDPESPLEVTAERLPRRRAARSAALGLPTVVVQEGGYDLDTIGAPRARGRSIGTRGGHWHGLESIWVGKDEHEGVPPSRAGRPPPPHWRLEAIAADARPRSLTSAPPPARPSSSSDRDTSDVWLLDLEAAVRPERLTTGRDPVAVLGGHGAGGCRPTGRRSRTPTGGHVWVVADGGRPAAPARRGRRPASGSTTRASSSAVERDDTTRLAVVDVADPWPRRLAVAHGDSTRTATRARPPSPPTAREVAYTFSPHDDLNRTRDPRRRPRRRRGARAARARPACTTTARRGRPTAATIAYASERSGCYELHLVGSDGTSERQLTSARADHVEPAWHPDGDAPRRHPRPAQPLRPRRRRRAERRGRGRSPRAARGAARAGLPDGADRRHATRTTRRRPQLRARRRPTALHAPAPTRDPRRAAHAALEEVTLRLLRRARDPRLPVPPGSAGRRTGAGRRLPARRPDRRLRRRVGRRRPVLRRQGLRVVRAQLPRQHRLRARLRARATTACGASTTRSDCLAAPTTCARSTGSTATALAIFGASYGCYMALLVGDRRPRAPLRCAVAQVRRLRHPHLVGAGRPRGRPGPRADDGPPRRPRARLPRRAHRSTGSTTSQVPAAHRPRRARRARAARSSPRSSSPRCAGSARQFEYVTYPTEGHGLLRAGPSWTSTAGSSASSTGTSCERLCQHCLNDDAVIVAPGEAITRTPVVARCRLRAHARRRRVGTARRIGRRKPVTLHRRRHAGHRQPEPDRRVSGVRVRVLEHAVRHAHRQGGRRLRHHPRARRVVDGARDDGLTYTYTLRDGPEVERRRAAHRRGRRLHDQHVARPGVAQPLRRHGRTSRPRRPTTAR